MANNGFTAIKTDTMKTKFAFTVILIFTMLLPSCSSDDELSIEEDARRLEALFQEIQSMAESQPCEDASIWTFRDYGSKACGGPVGYIAYPTTIDTGAFLEKIEAHRAAQQAFNEKWDVISDCSFPAQPTGILCRDGLPVLQYD